MHRNAWWSAPEISAASDGHLLRSKPRLERRLEPLMGLAVLEALRLSNVDGSLTSVAPWALPSAAVLGLGPLARLLGRPLGCAAVPLLAMGWAAATLVTCMALYRLGGSTRPSGPGPKRSRPCWRSWCLPSLSDVCGRWPNRRILRGLLRIKKGYEFTRRRRIPGCGAHALRTDLALRRVPSQHLARR